MIAYAYRTGSGIVGDPRVMHLPEAAVTDPLFKLPRDGGLGVSVEPFYYRAFGNQNPQPFDAPGTIRESEYGYPLQDSQVRWISKDDPAGLKTSSCGY